MHNFYLYEYMFQRFRCIFGVFFLHLKASMGEEDSEEFKQHVYRLEHSFGQKGRLIPLKYIVMGDDNLNIVYVYVPLYLNCTDFFSSKSPFIFLIFYQFINKVNRKLFHTHLMKIFEFIIFFFLLDSIETWKRAKGMGTEMDRAWNWWSRYVKH